MLNHSEKHSKSDPIPRSDPLNVSEKAAKDTTDPKASVLIPLLPWPQSPTEAKHSETALKGEKEGEQPRESQQSIDLSKSQYDAVVQREEDPTVKVEIEETKSIPVRARNQ